MMLGSLSKSANLLSKRERENLSESLALAKQSLQEVGTLAHLLYPPELDLLGLIPALRSYIQGFSKRAGIQVDLSAPSAITRLSREVETALFRIVQESLSNIYLHSQSPTAVVRVVLDTKEISLQVEDHGTGIVRETLDSANRDAPNLGLGIVGMRERVAQLGGQMDISSDSQGTKMSVTLPLPKDG